MTYRYTEEGDREFGLVRLRWLFKHFCSQVECDHFKVASVEYDKLKWQIVLDMFYDGEKVGETILQNAPSIKIAIKGAQIAHHKFVTETIPDIVVPMKTTQHGQYLN